MTEWLFVLHLATGDLISWPADPYQCRRHEMRVAARIDKSWNNVPVLGAVCLRRPSMCQEGA